MARRQCKGTTRIELIVHKVPVLDTGIGREAGYKDDTALLGAGEAQRAALTGPARRMLDEIEALEARAFLGG